MDMLPVDDFGPPGLAGADLTPPVDGGAMGDLSIDGAIDVGGDGAVAGPGHVRGSALGGGCDCSLAPRGSLPRGPLALLALGVALLLRRRRAVSFPDRA